MSLWPKLSLLFVLPTMLGTSGWAGDLSAKGACTENESWNLGASLDARSRNEFQELLKNETTAARGYVSAAQLESAGTTPEARLLGTYWKGAALLKANLVHLAFESFSHAASASPSAATLGVQTAAIECLNRLKLEYPALQAPQEVLARLPQFLALAPTQLQPFQELAIQAIQSVFGGQSSRSEITEALGFLKGTGAYEALGTGMAAAANGDHRLTIQALERFLKSSRLSPALLKQLNPARQLLARAYFSVKEFEQAAKTYKLIDRSSNLFAETLSELAWTHLLDENYSEAIGIATNVQVGSLRGTFVPEAPMVLAMSLNELCQYPDSLRAIRGFQNEYRPVYEWLKKWAARGSAHAQPLYPLAIGYLSKKSDAVAVPARIASEWIKSNSFISLQEEVSLAFKEDRAIAALNTQILHEKSDGPSWSELSNRLAHALVASGKLRQDRVARINATLAAKSTQMLAQLDEIAENTKLIQVEIFNGASHDIIWQNAHSDFHDVSRKWKMESKKDPAASRVWDWGHIRRSGEKVELWEDEMGAFKAKLFDNCSNKQRYMALHSLDG